jgi:hypothetical protein
MVHGGVLVMIHSTKRSEIPEALLILVVEMFVT